MREAGRLAHRAGRLSLGQRTLVMGIVNVTPDSFSDGGLSHRPEDAIAAALRLAAEGADILDLGAESTRPGHEPVSAEEEWSRLQPVLAGLANGGPLPPISVDTQKAEVARRALEAGAAIVNDVWGFQRDPAMATVAAESGAGVVLMHNRATADPAIDILDEILRFLERSVAIATAAGVGEDRIVLDPGIGFGKTPRQSFAAVAALPRIKALGFPVLLGLSRKRFIAGLFEPPPEPRQRMPGTIAANTFGVLTGGADIIRVHDVAEHVQALRVIEALRSAAA
jgi:dihydropteroate synthase